MRGMNKTARRELTDEERAECARLKAVYEKRKAEAKDRGEKLTQADVGDACGWKSGQSAVNQYFNGKVPLNVEAILKLSEVLGFKPVEVSPRLSAEIIRIAQAAPMASSPPADNPKPKEAAAAKVMEMLQKHREGLSAAAQQRIADAVADSLREQGPATSQPSDVIIADFLPPAPAGDAIRIAHYDVRTALGSGQLVPDYPEIMPDLVVSKQHLQELGVIYKDPSHLKMLTGYGQSMAPTIQHLDPMIVDVSIREFEGDGIYSFVWQGHFYTKRLQVADAEHFEMISDNPNHKDRMIRIEDTYIQARVLLVWNAKKL
ncbi:Prophage PSPPH03, transcriptional regulator, Cro/CI family [Azotobacter chroococcum NCIMB 8003]|uniref:Prophage PSPPH03, transcriptional regulator, Cro/CI family n=1 Tax=Azotobacter chroococcum NCIMB 8003 TaxID=1328314 RepID=A0A0C4WPI4_9GAMM|nr:Prophage PSPPH03, transcriptional regulator, Cro/CI family [Azotobacter chroococcum NCIMB 8003]